MDAFITCVSLVGLAEIGDKTQLLALVLAARFCRATPVICGVTLATLLNHFCSAWVGRLLGLEIHGTLLHLILAAFFIGTGLFALRADKLGEHIPGMKGHGAFVTSLISFFMAEMGDKTQLATVALGARFPNTMVVIAGTTVGMLLADIPAVLIGQRLLALLPLKVLRYVAAALFIALGVWEIADLIATH